MRREESCGAILYTKENGKRLYVLVMEANGNYGFPKGHIEGEETEYETCIREIKEETGVDAKILPRFRRTIQYPIPSHNTVKSVVYFVAKYENQELNPMDKDIMSAKKYDLQTALSLLKFGQIKDLLVEADFMLDINGD